MSQYWAKKGEFGMFELLVRVLYAFILVVLALMIVAVVGKVLSFLKGLFWDNLLELFETVRSSVRRHRRKDGPR